MSWPRPSVDTRGPAPKNYLMALDTRSREVLNAVVQEYILNGDAVASGRLVRSQGLRQSASTVRNIMSHLTEEGLLRQPHTSAGRIPTDQGLRFFIDQLMNANEITADDRRKIMAQYKLSNVELQEMLREVSRLLSDLSQQCALVLVPRVESARVQRIQFVPLPPDRMLVILVTDAGMVHNRIMEADQEISSDELEGVHRYLNELCHGRELRELHGLVRAELKREQTRYDELEGKALQLAARALPDEEAEPATMLVQGQSLLVGKVRPPELEQMKAVLRAVEEKRTVLKLLDETIRADGVKVFIGAETGVEPMSGYSLVARSYGGSSSLGTLGVLGPSNMDYPMVLPLVDFTADLLTQFLCRA